MNGQENTNPKIEESKKTDFSSFSESLSKLKLKRNINKDLSKSKFAEGQLAASGNLTELEKLLMQLKNTNASLKEEIGANISVNNNYNININSNINLQSSAVVESKAKEKTMKENNLGEKLLAKNEIYNEQPMQKERANKDRELKNLQVVNIIDNARAEDMINSEVEKENDMIYHNISEIKNDPLETKQDYGEEDLELKKFIGTPQKLDEIKVAMVNDIWDEDSFSQDKNIKTEVLKADKLKIKDIDNDIVCSSNKQNIKLITNSKNFDTQQKNIVTLEKVVYPDKKTSDQNKFAVLNNSSSPKSKENNKNNLDFFESETEQSFKELSETKVTKINEPSHLLSSNSSLSKKNEILVNLNNQKKQLDFLGQNKINNEELQNIINLNSKQNFPLLSNEKNNLINVDKIKDAQKIQNNLDVFDMSDIPEVEEIVDIKEENIYKQKSPLTDTKFQSEIKTQMDNYYDKNQDSPLIKNSRDVNFTFQNNIPIPSFQNKLITDKDVDNQKKNKINNKGNFVEENESISNQNDPREKDSLLVFDPKDIAMMTDNYGINNSNRERLASNREITLLEKNVNYSTILMTEQIITEDGKDFLDEKIIRQTSIKRSNEEKTSTANPTFFVKANEASNKRQESKMFKIVENETPEFTVEKKNRAPVAYESDFVLEDAVEDTPIMSKYKETENINEDLNKGHRVQLSKEVTPTKKQSEKIDTMDAFFGGGQKEKEIQKREVIPDSKSSNTNSQNIFAVSPSNKANFTRNSKKEYNVRGLGKEEKEPLKKDPIPIEEIITKEKENDQKDYNSNSVLIKEEAHDTAKYKKLVGFEKNEIHYNETVNDFAKIFREKNYLFLKRRKYFMHNEYYRYYFLKENNIVDKYRKLPHNYTEILEDGLSSYLRESEFHTIFQDVIGDDNDNKADVLRLLEKKKEDSSSLIGKIKPIRTFLDKYNINHTNEKDIFEEATKDVVSWREVLCDGDSFYRSFMFGLFEFYILNQNLHEIQKLILDIFRIHKNPGATLFKTRKINFNILLVTFQLIVEHLTNKNIEEAYEVLLKAYSIDDPSFDLVLIGYIRLIMYLNVAELEKQVSKFKRQPTSGETNLARKNTNGTIQIEFEEVNTETFLVYQNEPTKLALSLIPLVFNVSVDLWCFDGSLHHNKNNITFIRQKFVQNPLNEVPVISICYNLSSYSSFYSKQFYEKFSGILKLFYDPLLTRNCFLGREEDCEKCSKITKTLVLVKYGISVCSECVKKFVQDTMEKRAIIFNKENFINRECMLF